LFAAHNVLQTSVLLVHDRAMSTPQTSATASSSAPPAAAGLRRNGAPVVIIRQSFGSRIPPEAARGIVDQSLTAGGRNPDGVPGSHRAEAGRTHYTAGASIPDATAGYWPGNIEVLVTNPVEADQMDGKASTVTVGLKMRTLRAGGETIDPADARPLAHGAFDIELAAVASALHVDTRSLGREHRQELVTDQERDVLG
jgi:hypothetical protein